MEDWVSVRIQDTRANKSRCFVRVYVRLQEFWDFLTFTCQVVHLNCISSNCIACNWMLEEKKILVMQKIVMVDGVLFFHHWKPLLTIFSRCILQHWYKKWLPFHLHSVSCDFSTLKVSKRSWAKIRILKELLIRLLWFFFRWNFPSVLKKETNLTNVTWKGVILKVLKKYRFVSNHHPE